MIDWREEYEKWVTLEVLPILERGGRLDKKRHCPIPSRHAGGDKHPSFRISRGVPVCSCGIQHEKHPYQLIASAIGAVSWEEYKALLLGDGEEAQRLRERSLPPPPPVIEPPKPVLTYTDVPSWMTRLWCDAAQRDIVKWLAARGITREWGEVFMLGWTGDDPNLQWYNQNRIAIPWFINCELVGVKLRKDPRSADQKAYKYGSIDGSDFEPYLFNQDCLAYCGREVLGVETELDCIAKAAQSGEDNAIAKPALQLREHHIILLTGKRFTLIRDTGERGLKHAQHIKQLMPDAVIRLPPAPASDLGDAYKLGLEVTY